MNTKRKTKQNKLALQQKSNNKLAYSNLETWLCLTHICHLPYVCVLGTPTSYPTYNLDPYGRNTPSGNLQTEYWTFEFAE